MSTAPALSSSSPPPTAADEVGAAALLMGTAIGGGFLAEEQESLAQAKVRLNNEVDILKEKEKGIEARLRQQMCSFVELREEQWEALVVCPHVWRL